MPKTTHPHTPGVATPCEMQTAGSVSILQSVLLNAGGPAETSAGLLPLKVLARRARPADCTARGELPTAEEPLFLLPQVSLVNTDPGEVTLTRQGVLESKRWMEAQRAQAFKETRGLGDGNERNALYKEIRWYATKAEELEDHLERHFLPQHGPEQFLSPRVFFVSPLFGVRSRTQLRKKHVELELPTTHGKSAIQYMGPELRQSDGLVFLTLVHMLRDVQVGTAVTLQPKEVCMALFGRYDGNSRHQLREHIQRLQQGLLVFETFSVQMCLRFDYPKTGCWTVALDKKIIEIFRCSPATWIALSGRLALPDGLATWLYAYVYAQTRLIPMQLTTLCKLCGSDAGEKAFGNRLRVALKLLATHGVIDTGWSVGNGEVRWRKPLKSQ